jgi:hypothetical protein
MSNLALVHKEAVPPTTSLVGCALLAVNMDSNKKSFLDFFVPLLIEGLNGYTEDFITLENLSKILSEKFDVNLPEHVIRSLINKLKKDKYVFYDSSSRCYKPNREKLSGSNFKDKQLHVMEKHGELISNLQEYLIKHFNLEVDSFEAEEMFEKFLANHDTIPYDLTNSNYLVSSFLKKLQEEQPVLFAYYESILVGNMFATAMYFTEPDRIQQKFKNTVVYFDTTFLIYALGYSGEIREKPCMQLIEMLRRNGAILRCFEHNVDEIESILRGCANRIETGLTDNFGTTEYFIQKKFLPSDIYRLIYGIREEIQKKLNIKVVERPPYDNQLYVIDERELSNYLSTNIRYKPVSLERDVESVTSIFRLRKGFKSKSIEKCKAIFVTTNEGLSYFTNKYFQQHHQLRDNAPLIITDYALTTLMWVKNPDLNPTLPRKRIIADCYASQQPPEYLVKKYLDKIQELKEKNEISEQDYYLLRVNPEARKILMHETQGDENALTAIKIHEIAELTKLKLVEDKELEIEVQKMELKEKDRILTEVTYEIERERNSHKLLREKQQGKAKLFSKGLIVIASLIVSGLFCLGQYVALNIIEVNMPKAISITLYGFFCIFFPLLSFWGIGILNPFIKAQNKLAVKIDEFLYQ